MLRRWKDVFGPLLPTATVEKLVSIDLELLNDHKNVLVRSRPFPANAVSVLRFEVGRLWY